MLFITCNLTGKSYIVNQIFSFAIFSWIFVLNRLYRIEGLNRQYRKVTKTKSVFPSDSALEKMLYLVCENVAAKWTQRYQNWDQVLNQLIVLYGERFTDSL